MDDEEFESLPTAERQRIMGMLQENPLADTDEPTMESPPLTPLQIEGAKLYHEINAKYNLDKPTEGFLDWMT